MYDAYKRVLMHLSSEDKLYLVHKNQLVNWSTLPFIQHGEGFLHAHLACFSNVTAGGSILLSRVLIPFDSPFMPFSSYTGHYG